MTVLNYLLDIFSARDGTRYRVEHSDPPQSELLHEIWAGKIRRIFSTAARATS